MGTPATTLNLGLQASDVSGQRMVKVRDIPHDSTIGELMRGLVSRMRLPANDTGGRPLTYHARLEREGRHLHASELARDALHEGDHIVLQPNIDAGGRRRNDV